MEETINFKLAKRLNDEGLLEGVETKYYYDDKFLIKKEMVDLKNYKQLWLIKTLTLSEAIEFLPAHIKQYKLRWTKWDEANPYWPRIWYSVYYVCEYNWKILDSYFTWKTLLEAISNMIEYLLNNNLLWTN